MSSSDPISFLAEGLNRQASLKLWSLIVTIMGDLSQAGVDEIEGPKLAALIERIGLQPQAMRVALHRLKQDGWVQSRREGRLALHSLTSMGKTETRRAVKLVYSDQQPAKRGVVLVTLPEGSDGPHSKLLQGTDFVQLNRQSYLTDPSAAKGLRHGFAVSLEKTHKPQWVIDRLQHEGLDEDFKFYDGLLTSLQSFQLEGDELELWALRVLILHGWRRLIVKANPVALEALGYEAAAFQLRTRMCDTLATFELADRLILREKLTLEGSVNA